jgi:hypothetical protein
MAEQRFTWRTRGPLVVIGVSVAAAGASVVVQQSYVLALLLSVDVVYAAFFAGASVRVTDDRVRLGFVARPSVAMTPAETRIDFSEGRRRTKVRFVTPYGLRERVTVRMTRADADELAAVWAGRRGRLGEARAS